MALVESLLRKSRVGYLGLVDDDEPYVIPLNFVWYRDCLYIHGAQSGRKAALLSRAPRSTFTVSEDNGTLADPVPAKTDTAYLSVMLFGRICAVPDLEESTAALDAMLTKYVPGYYEAPLHPNHVKSYLSSAGSHVAVYRLTPDRITAKHNPLDWDRLFYPGRTQKFDARLCVARKRAAGGRDGDGSGDDK
ncbi:pyridoxamine 5'-phosphate oxidase family protein [Alicyclobacillus cycloheptanicus]|nr:pyridoxamine 5'-phosphate oxidase family protein [Alicyclobacillus cycloheptanicus]